MPSSSAVAAGNFNARAPTWPDVQVGVGAPDDGWTDRTCDVFDSAVLSLGQSASVQCNGIRAPTLYDTAKAPCSVKPSYRGLDSISRQGRGERTDWG